MAAAAGRGHNDVDGKPILPPYAVDLSYRIQKYGIPNGESWLDWPAGLIDDMTYLRDIYDAHRSLSHMKGANADWAKANPYYNDLVNHVIGIQVRAKYGV